MGVIKKLIQTLKYPKELEVDGDQFVYIMDHVLHEVVNYPYEYAIRKDELGITAKFDSGVMIEDMINGSTLYSVLDDMDDMDDYDILDHYVWILQNNVALIRTLYYVSMDYYKDLLDGVLDITITNVIIPDKNEGILVLKADITTIG